MWQRQNRPSPPPRSFLQNCPHSQGSAKLESSHNVTVPLEADKPAWESQDGWQHGLTPPLGQRSGAGLVRQDMTPQLIW